VFRRAVKNGVPWIPPGAPRLLPEPGPANSRPNQESRTSCKPSRDLCSARNSPPCSLPQHRIQQALMEPENARPALGALIENPAKIFRRDECGWKAASIAGLGS